MAIRAAVPTLTDLVVTSGRGGGQTVVGGTQSGSELTLASSPNSDGVIEIGSGFFLDESGTLKKLGIFTFTPQNALDIPVDVRLRGAGTGALIVTNDVLGVSPGAGGAWSRDTSAGNLSPTVQTDTVTVLNTILSTTANPVFDFTTSQYAVPVGGLPAPTLRIPVRVNGVDYDIALSPHGTGPASPPTGPTTLTATAISSSQINLQWTDNSTDETGFKIERSRDNFATFISLTTTAANVTVYSDTGLLAATTYYYRVRATNANGDSANSSVASATTQSLAGSVTDNLNGTDGTSLASHTSDSGHAWTLVRGAWTLRGTNTGYANNSGSSNPLALCWISGQGADGTVICGMTSQSPSTYPYGSLQNGICMRYDATSDKCVVLIAADNGHYQLREFDGGTPGTIFATLNVAPAIGDLLKVQMAGSTWNVWIASGTIGSYVQYVTNLTITQSWTSTGHHGLCNTWNNAFNQPEWFQYSYTP